MKYFFTLLLIASFATSNAQPGTIDKSYGTDKTGTVSVYKQLFTTSSIMQPDDKLVLGGWGLGTGQFAMAGHNKDGSIDTSFGNKGFTFITIDDLVDGSYFPQGFLSIALEADKKMVATGSYFGFDLGNHIIVARFLSNGTPDETFGSHGRVVTGLGLEEYGNAIAVQPDGKIIVAGYQAQSQIDGGNTIGILLIRYNPDGSFDKSFGDNQGYTIYNKERSTQGYALLLQEDGKIIVGGLQVGGGFFTVRYLPDGTLDESFGAGGSVKTVFPAKGGTTQINSLAFDDKARIVAAGTIGANEGTGIARYLPDGAIDNSFGVEGKVQLDFNGIYHVTGKKVLAASEGKLIITSVTEGLEDTSLSLALTGLNEDGTIDPSFGTDKEQTTVSLGFTDDVSVDAAMQSDGKVIVSGNNYNPYININTYYLTRFNGYPVHVSLAVRIKRYLQNHGITWNGLPANDKIAYYSVEQSSSNRTGFTPIAKLSGRSNLHDYSFTNAQLLQGANYYRIKAISTDGTIRYSEVVSADNITNSASIYPNPASNSITVKGLPGNETANISIKDGSGTVLSKGVSSGGNQYRSSLANLQPGTYYMNITTTTKTETLKFVKE